MNTTVHITPAQITTAAEALMKALEEAFPQLGTLNHLALLMATTGLAYGHYGFELTNGCESFNTAVAANKQTLAFNKQNGLHYELIAPQTAH